jgi:4-amino-4-deoxy-L-arabinose transferase-like glycosyltransferase
MVSPSPSGRGAGGARLAAGFGRLAGAWLDAPGGQAVAILLGLFVLAWTGFQILSYASIDLHPDLVEVYGWSRHPSLGYHKHPPLGGLIAALWFGLFPAQDWAFHLLAMTNAAIGLLATDAIARRHLSGDKRLAVLLLLLLTPFYQFHGQRFGSNQTMLSTWPIAVYCFLEAYESRHAGWAAAAGVAAALAMLGKYYSVFLLVGLAVAALVDPRRERYWRSASPWISLLAGLAVLAPHLVWLVGNGFPPVRYAFATHDASGFAATAVKAVAYAAGAVGYAAIPIAAWLVLVRPDRATVKAALWPADPRLRMLAVLLWVPLAAPIPVALAAGVELTSLWTMPGWFLLPVLLLAPATAMLRRPAAIGLAGVVAALTLAMLLASPALAWWRHVEGTKEARAYFRLLAVEATRLFEATTGRPLTIVAGDPDLAAATTFYAPGHPDALAGYDLRTAPWITPARLAGEGWVALCKAEDDECLAGAARLAGARAGLRREDLRLVPRFLGVPGPSRRFSLLVVPPLP